MSAEFKINKGLDIPMEGAPGDQVRRIESKGTLSVYPSEFKNVKFKILVEEGDKVVRGGVLARRKDIPDCFVRSPAAGTVKSVILGARRSLKEIVIEPAGSDDAETFDAYTAADLLSAEREKLLAELTDTGMLGVIRQRPFSHTANPADVPKSIFVNGMATAPFRPDAHVLVRGKEKELQAGLNALTRLTDGPVHLNLDAKAKSAGDALTGAEGVQVNYFEGPHPSGNTGTHVHYLDPIVPGDVVWTLRVSDVLLIGELLLTGRVPNRKTVLLAGPGVKEEFRGYVDAPLGAPMSELLEGALEEGDLRVVRGDALHGEAVNVEDSGLYLYDEGFVVLPEDRERHLLGWYAPTTEQFSAHKVVPSAWVKEKKRFSFGTNTRGSKRALVLTGIYDPYVTLDIMMDPFIRVCIAGETEEAIAMGILESDPEDFALCTFVCPSKTDFGHIVAETLSMIEEEGI